MSRVREHIISYSKLLAVTLLLAACSFTDDVEEASGLFYITIADKTS